MNYLRIIECYNQNSKFENFQMCVIRKFKMIGFKLDMRISQSDEIFTDNCNLTILKL